MSFYEDKPMHKAKISRACANFLADGDARPGEVQGAGSISPAGDHRVSFFPREGRWAGPAAVPIIGRGLIRGTLLHQRRQRLATLDLEGSWFRYRESMSGTSMLTLFGPTLPDAVCLGYRAGSRRLGDVIDFSRYKPCFFIRANPVVRSIRNVRRLRQLAFDRRGYSAGLLITMRDEWSHGNWGFWRSDTGFTIDRLDRDGRVARSS